MTWVEEVTKHFKEKLAADFNKMLEDERQRHIAYYSSVGQTRRVFSIFELEPETELSYPETTYRERVLAKRVRELKSIIAQQDKTIAKKEEKYRNLWEYLCS